MSNSAKLKTHPHNIEAERSVIGAVLIDPDAIFKLDAKLAPADFYDPVYRAIYGVMQRLTEEGTVIDPVTLNAALADNETVQRPGGTAFFAQITAEVPTSSHVEHYADIVLGHSRRRQLAALGRQLSDRAADETRSPAELMDEAEQAFLKVSRGSATYSPVSLVEMITERFDHYTLLHEADDPTAHYGLRTGFADLDRKLTGMAPGDFIVLAARPSMGKTALALNIACSVGIEQGKTVGILSLEMEKEQLFDRIFGHLAGIPPTKITRGNLSDDDFINLGTVFDRLAEQQIFVDDDPNRELANIRSKARRLQIEHGLDLLIIDYLQLIQVTDRIVRDSRTREMSHISENVKQLARELKCPVLALSQLSRECERRTNKRPQLSDLRDSGSIEQDADRVLMLYRDVYYNEETDEPDVAELGVLKNRHGPTGQVELHFDSELMTFQSLAKQLPA